MLQFCRAPVSSISALLRKFFGLCWPRKTGITFFDFLVFAVDMVRSCVVKTHLEVAWAHRFWWFFALNGPVFAAVEGFSA